MAGMLFGIAMQFLSRILLARFGTEVDYGNFSLSFALLTIATIVASIGLHVGSTRLLAYLISRGQDSEVSATVRITCALTVASSIIVSLIIFFSSNSLAVFLFHDPEMTNIIKILSIAVPFLTSVNILAAIFRGFSQVGPQVIFQYIILNALFPLLILIAMAAGLSFVSTYYCYLITSVLTNLLLIWYVTKKLPASGRSNSQIFSNRITGQLMKFSLPLFGNTLASVIITYMDTLTLGYYTSGATVGLYNAAFPLAQFVVAPLSALGLVYVPIATGLFVQGSLDELRRSYTVLTKWMVSITLPLVLVFCIFPEAVLGFLFGPQYTEAAGALRILAIGFMVNNFFGPNAPALIAVGESMWLFGSGMVMLIGCVILNLTLIPVMGLQGAAFAAAGTMLLGNAITGPRLYFLYRLQPLSLNLIKPVVVSTVLIVAIQVIFARWLVIDWWMLPIIFILYYAAYFLIVVATRSFEDEDKALLVQMAKYVGIDASTLRNKLGRRPR